MSASTTVAGTGGCEIRVHECGSCWSRRALALAAARARFRENGELGQASDGRMTWRGACIDDAAHDPIAGAVLSELLRMGIAVATGALVRLSPRALGIPVTVAAS
jgi:hypothetical protein